MLVATPGQTTAYHPLKNGTTNQKKCNTQIINSNTTTTTTQNNSLPHKTMHPVVYKVAETSTGQQTAATLMKTLSVRLNHPNPELIKGNFKKTITGVSQSNISNSNSNSNNNNNPPTTTTTTTTSASQQQPITIIDLTTINTDIIKKFTVPPTAIHRNSQPRSRGNSIDSLRHELCYFKPIRSVPTTPVKCSSKSRGASLKFPKAVLSATAANLHSNCDDYLKKDDEGNIDPLCKSCYGEKYRPKSSFKKTVRLRPDNDSPLENSAFVRIIREFKKKSTSIATQRHDETYTKSKTTNNSNNKNNPTTISHTRKRKCRLAPLASDESTTEHSVSKRLLKKSELDTTQQSATIKKAAAAAHDFEIGSLYNAQRKTARLISTSSLRSTKSRNRSNDSGSERPKSKINHKSVTRQQTASRRSSFYSVNLRSQTEISNPNPEGRLTRLKYKAFKRMKDFQLLEGLSYNKGRII